MTYFKTLILTLCLFGFLNFSEAHAINDDNEPDNYISVQIIPEKTNVSAGDTIHLAIKNTLYPKWHIYWINPGDSGTAPNVKWDLPEGFEAGDIKWPTPAKIPFPPLMNFGYEDEVTLLQELTIPANISSDPITIKGNIDYLVCHDICIPESHAVEFTLNDGNVDNSSIIQEAFTKLPTHKDWNATYALTAEHFILDIETNDTITNDHVLLPVDWGLIDNTATATITKTDAGYQFKKAVGDRDLAEVNDIELVINNDTQSFQFSAQKAGATTANTTDTPTTEKTYSTTILQALIYALIGGVILNLMPCVFPVLSMKALSLMQLQGKEEKKAQMYGLSYTAGILLSFGLIAGILIALKAFGAEIGWGFQLQNPIVITVLIYLIFAIGLNMIGLFEISGRIGNVGQNLTQKSGNKGAFFTGVLATLVATPCTAPFMATAIGFALTQPAIVSMLIFLSLGLGLALPYLALCFIPALRHKLPKPGAWMENFRQFLSFPMFLTAAYLVWVLSQQVNGAGVLYTLVGLIAITFILWLKRFNPSSKKLAITNKILIILTALFVIYVPFTLKGIDQAISAEKIGDNWSGYSSEKLSNLLSTTDEPIFVNMTAAWCITCKVNERIALSPQSTKELFKSMNVQYLKGDWTNQDPGITKYLEEFDRSGVPLYVYYPPRDQESGARPEAVLLPQLLTKGIIERALL